jgi:hypothetical protein
MQKRIFVSSLQARTALTKLRDCLEAVYCRRLDAGEVPEAEAE